MNADLPSEASEDFIRKYSAALFRTVTKYPFPWTTFEDEEVGYVLDATGDIVARIIPAENAEIFVSSANKVRNGIEQDKRLARGEAETN